VLQFDFTREDSGGGGKASSVALDASTLVESEARIIRSLATARAVASRLGLDKAPSSQSPSLLAGAAELVFPMSVRNTLRHLTGFGDTAAEPTPRDVAAQRLLGSLGVSNDTKAYLVTLTFRDTDPGPGGADRQRLRQRVSTPGRWKRPPMPLSVPASGTGAQAQEARANLGADREGDRSFPREDRLCRARAGRRPTSSSSSFAIC
jgi:succinoglycan biosynthesis transport protein ExoP